MTHANQIMGENVSAACDGRPEGRLASSQHVCALNGYYLILCKSTKNKYY